MFTRCMDIMMGSICLGIGTITGAGLEKYGLTPATMVFAVVSYPIVLVLLYAFRYILLKASSSWNRLSAPVLAYVAQRKALREGRLGSDLASLIPEDKPCADGLSEAKEESKSIPVPENTHPNPIAHRFNLTQREGEVFAYLSRGRSAKYIADELVLSENTVWAHIKRIYAKTGCHSKQEIMDLAEQTLD